MKKSFTIALFALLASFTINAQTLSLTDDNNNPIPNGSRIDIPLDQMFTYIHVTNNSSDSIHARSKKIHEYIPEGDEICLCWLGCESHETMIVPPLTKNPVTIQAGATDEGFDITYFPGESGEFPKYTIVFFYEENPDDTAYFYVNWDGITGIEEQSNNDIAFSAFPNPASDYVTIDYNIKDGKNNELVFYDLFGKEISRQKLNGRQGKIELNTSNWADGIYYYSISQDARKALSSKKLIISH